MRAFQKGPGEVFVWRQYRRYNLSFSQATSPCCSFFPPGKVILILQDESLMACLCGQTDCMSYSGTAAALQVFWSISCVQIKRTSSWHNYLENCFASVFEHVPWDSFWDSSPLPLPGELRACPCEKLLSTTARLANHPHMALLQPHEQSWEVGFPYQHQQHNVRTLC